MTINKASLIHKDRRIYRPELCDFYYGKAVVLFIAFLLLLSFESFGWKAKAHLYFAEEALKDALDDDSVALLASDGSLIGPFGVNRNILDAVRQYPEQFRAGAIGPDAYPDILTGQQLIHPASPGSCHWLNYLWNETAQQATLPQRAFVAGFFSHAAGDLFGHTFINHFAGGPFELGINAVKHIVVEGYFDKCLPGIITWDGHEFTEKDVQIDDGLDDFIYRKLVFAAPGSYLARCLFMGKDSLTSIPKYFSKVRNSLDLDIRQYYGKIASFDKEYNSLIESAADCDLWDWGCSKVILYSAAALTLAEKTAYQAINFLPVCYKEYWLADVDDGLKKWPGVSHEINLALNCADTMDTERAETAAGDFAINNMLSMMGAPDVLGTTISFIKSVLDAIVPEFIQKAIEEAQKKLLDFILKKTIGFDQKELSAMMKDPENQFMVLGLDVEEFRKNELHLKDGDTLMDYLQVPAAINTVNMIKLSFLPKPEIQRLLTELNMSGITFDRDNIMLGRWFGSLDESCQWTSMCDTMILARDQTAFSKIFRRQTGDTLFPEEMFANCTIHEAEPAGTEDGFFDIRTFSDVLKSETKHDYVLDLPYDSKISMSINATEKRAFAHLGFLPSEVMYSDVVCDEPRNLEYRFQRGQYNFDVHKVLLRGVAAAQASPKPISYTAIVTLTPCPIQDNAIDDSSEIAFPMAFDSLYFRNIGFYRGDGTNDIYDYYCFTTRKNDIVFVDFSGIDIGENVQFEMFDTTGINGFYNRALSGSARISFVMSALPEGKYTFRIRSVNPGSKGFGSYTIRLRRRNLETENNKSKTSALQLSNILPVAGFMNETDSVHWFSVETKDGIPVTAELSKAEALSLKLEIFNDKDSLIDTATCNENSCRAATDTLETGTYFVKINRKGGSGEYLLVLEGVESTPVEVKRHPSRKEQEKTGFRLVNGSSVYLWSYSPERAGVTRIGLFDLKGRKVGDLFYGHMQAGEIYKGEISSFKMTSGIYFIVLESKLKREVCRLVFRK